MKLPKNFGGKGFASALQEAQSAMSRAKDIEGELEQERLGIDKGPVKAIFSGTGELMALKIDPEILDPEDTETLEDLIMSAVRDGFSQATQLRQAKLEAILPNVPGADKLLGG
jgi:DNA-binding YbaB/EbfC family protein